MQINILEYLEKTLAVSAPKPAIIDGERIMTFNEVSLSAKSIALALCELDCINKPIGVFLPKSADTVITDIAITYSGNIYMNLDIRSPLIRLGNILKQVEPVAIVTSTEYEKILTGLCPDIRTILIDTIQILPAIDSAVLDKIREKIIDTDPLCIINTSGSTGTPKAAVLNHRSYIDYTDWAINTFKFRGDEVLGVLSPVVFDHYNYEICLMMAIGCTLVLLDNQMASFPVVLLETLQKQHVSYIFWVPSIMVNIANMDLLSRIHLPDLRMVWFAGEVFPTKQFNYWKKWLPDATFVNLYGPVETSVDCTYFIVNRDLDDSEPIPIGYPCRNTDIIILTNENTPALTGEEGELCVRGTSLSMGYFNNSDKTSSSFVQNPLNSAYPEIIYRTGDIVSRNDKGEIIFRGRKDTLIKHMGYRIELGEIEHIIVNSLHLVEKGCVIYNFEEKEIILFYENKEELSVTGIKTSLAKHFPKYMIPTKYLRLNSLPRNANGKTDRLYLSEMLKNKQL